MTGRSDEKRSLVGDASCRTLIEYISQMITIVHKDVHRMEHSIITRSKSCNYKIINLMLDNILP